MGNNIASNQATRLLDEEQCELLTSYWNSTNTQPIFMAAWISALNSCPEIKAMFGLSPGDNPMYNTMVVRTITEIEEFFSTLIIEMELDKESCKMTCEALGERHFGYSETGFKKFYYDIYTACLLQTFEEELTLRGRERVRLTMAWRKFIQITVDYMRSGYENREVKRYP